MTVLLVDDEQLQLTRLLNECQKVLPKDTSFLTYQNPVQALKENVDKKIDIAFLDIEMPGLNGVNLAKELKKNNPKINIIFVTAYDSYAIEAYILHASGYVFKPVNASKIKEEIESLRYEIDVLGEKKIKVKCFGNFEIFYNNEPIKFKYQKSKELIAYLIDREGSSINVNELNAILWEEDHPSYLRNLISDIQLTFNKLSVKDFFIKKHNQCYIDINKVDCDAYEYKSGNPKAINLYRGEYMSQYSWAFFKQ